MIFEILFIAGLTAIARRFFMSADAWQVWAMAGLLLIAYVSGKWRARREIENQKLPF